MARRSYMPGDDAGLCTWAESLARCISGEPRKYRFSPEQAAELVEVVQGYSAALQAASNPFTRTRGMVFQKNDARETCRLVCRRFAMVIKHDPSISDSDKIAAGVTPKPAPPEHVQRLLDKLALSAVNSDPATTSFRGRSEGT